MSSDHGLPDHPLPRGGGRWPRLAIIKAINLNRPIPIADGFTGDVITLGIEGDHERVLDLVRAEPFVREASVEDELIRLYVDQGDSAVPKLIRLLDGADLRANTLTLARPSLDDVFLRQTGRSLREEPAA